MASHDDLLLAKTALRERFLVRRFTGAKVGLYRLTFQATAARDSLEDNIHAVGIGSKIVEGRPKPIPCVRLYVARKFAKSFLPKKSILPETIDGIPTDVIESAPPFFAQMRKRTQKNIDRKSDSSSPDPNSTKPAMTRPIVAGISTAHKNVTAGTLSYFCRSTDPSDDKGDIFVLSNNHVYANLNKGRIGDVLRQPGPADGGNNSSFDIGILHRWIPIRFGSSSANRVDAAIGLISKGVPYSIEVCAIGKIQGTAKAVEGMHVCKFGRTTGYTDGVVKDDSLDAIIGMDPDNREAGVLFENQMRIEPIEPYVAFGRGGDSGSLVVQKNTREAVGLYFAGPQGGEYGIANFIGDVLEELHISLL